MKTTQTLLKLILLIFLTSDIQSCKKSDIDTQSPSIFVLLPATGDQFSTGSSVSVVATLHDYVELGKYRIEIRWNTDAQNISSNPNVAPWVFLLEEPLTGTNQAISKKITIPGNIRLGNYDVILYCLDKTGNEGSSIEIIKITG
jgi:hypothetical protein